MSTQYEARHKFTSWGKETKSKTFDTRKEAFEQARKWSEGASEGEISVSKIWGDESGETIDRWEP